MKDCTGLSKVENRILDSDILKSKSKGKPLKSALVQSSFMFSGNVSRRTYTDLEVEIEGRKSKVKTQIIHTFCPFCGAKYDDKDFECGYADIEEKRKGFKP